MSATEPMSDDCERIQANPAARLTFTIVGYGFEAEWHVIINSLLMQRRFTEPPEPTNPTPPTVPEDRWVAQLINDGPDPVARRVCMPYVEQYPDRLVYLETPQRFNDWGHTLRILGLARTATPWWNTQNADNYLMPSMVDLTLRQAETRMTTPMGPLPPQIVLFDAVHNYANVNNRQDPPYSVLEVEARRNRCDAGSFIVDTRLAQEVEWRSLASDSDGQFITDLVRAHARVTKVPGSILMAHN